MIALRRNKIWFTRLRVYMISHYIHSSNMLEVELNDAVLFLCQANSSEAPEDRIENIILLEKEAHLVQCDIGEEGQSRHLATCSRSYINHVLLITDSQNLVNRPSFSANHSYYFTSKCAEHQQSNLVYVWDLKISNAFDGWH